MGILDKLKEKSKWNSLEYIGGYPNKNKKFYCALRREKEDIIIYDINSLSTEMTIPKENILNLEIRQNRIITKIKHDGMEIELMFSSLNIEKAYSTMVTAINTETTAAIVPTDIKTTGEKDPNKNESNPYWEVNFWQKEWFMWVTLIFFAPVGIFLLWRYKRFNFKPRVVITIAFLAFFIFMWNTTADERAKENANATNSVQQEVKSEEPKKEEKSENKYSNISLNEIKYQDGKVNISGSTDLPNNSKLTISFDVAGRGDKDTYIGVNKDSLVQDGKFATELVPPNRQEFTLGKYVVEVLFTPKGQSQEIIDLVGSDGENLTGNYVKKNDMLNFNVLRVNKQVDLQLNIKPENYPMVDPNSYNSNAPERAFAEYLNSWKNKDWDNMVNYTQVTWRNSDKKPSESLKNQYDFKTLLGTEIKDKKVNSEVSTDVTATVYYRFGNNISVKTITARIIRETTSGELSTDGQWGVNPISAMREQ